MKRKTFILVLVITLSFALFNANAVASNFEWGMSEKEITKILGQPVNADIPERPGMKSLVYKDQSVSGINAYDMALFINNNGLFSIQYTFVNDIGHKTFSYLTGALESVYGESTEDISIVTQYFNTFVSDGFTDESAAKRIKAIDALYGTWKTEDTNIMIMFVTSGSEKYTVLSYTVPEEDIPDIEYNLDGLLAPSKKDESVSTGTPLSEIPPFGGIENGLFTIRNGIKWFMSKEEIEETLRNEQGSNQYKYEYIPEETIIQNMYYKIKNNDHVWQLNVENIPFYDSQDKMILSFYGSENFGLFLFTLTIVPYDNTDDVYYNLFQNVSSQIESISKKVDSKEDNWARRDKYKKEPTMITTDIYYLSDNTLVIIFILKDPEANDEMYSLTLNYVCNKTDEVYSVLYSE